MLAGIDIAGQRFGRLVALERTRQRCNGRVVWKCRCKCGVIVFVNSRNLVQGETKSCGCLQKESYSKNGRASAIDITGERFGRLVAVKATNRRLGSKIMWECVCDCGCTTMVCNSYLRTGSTKSCGCLSDAALWSRKTSIDPMDVPFEITHIIKVRRELRKAVKQAV